MKNKIACIFVLTSLILTGQPFSMAADTNKTPVRFIYINGSNSNTEKDKLTFISGMNAMHSSMKKEFESNNFIKKNMLNNGNTYVADKPKIFFWGYNSNSALSTVKEDLLSLSMISPKMAQTVRTMITNVMHDAIWVQKEYNMQVVINNLHKDVMASYKKGEKVVLFGHSAGSFVTFRYLFHKAPVILPEEIVTYAETNKNISNSDFFRKNPVKPTCMDAITSSGVGVFSSTGDFVINPNPHLLKENYLKLNNYTSTQCIPDNDVLGIVNFGSPVALFYSDKGGSSEDINKYNMDLYRYLKDNNLFFLTVNFTDDPIGFPLSKNLSSEELENIYNIGFSGTGKGFFYSKSDVKSPATFIGAHSSYWKYSNKFAKAVVSAYVDGYKNFYADL